MNKRGDMILRDVIMMIIVFTGIIAFCSIFVNEMGDTYENVNMTSSYNQDEIGETQLKNTSNTWEDIGDNLNGNFFEMLLGTAQAAKEILTEVLTAPATFGSLISSSLETIGVDESITSIVGFIITAGLYIVIIFVCVSAFLKGGRM